MRHVGILVAGLALLADSGCKPVPTPQPSSTGLPRVVSLAPSITEIVCALGATNQLVGRSSACDYPPDVVKRIPVIGNFGVPSLERLLAARPDVVLYTDLADLGLDQKLHRIGLKPARILCNRLDEIPAALVQVGQHVGRAADANRLADSLRFQIAQRRATPVALPRPRVLVLIWNDPLTAAGKNTFISDLIALAGGQNIGDEIDRDYFQVSSEWVLARNPEIVFCFFMASGRPVREMIMGQAGWGRVRAVQTGRVYDGFDNSPVLRPGPRVMEGLALIRPYIQGAP